MLMNKSFVKERDREQMKQLSRLFTWIAGMNILRLTHLMVASATALILNTRSGQLFEFTADLLGISRAYYGLITSSINPARMFKIQILCGIRFRMAEGVVGVPGCIPSQQGVTRCLQRKAAQSCSGFAN